MKSIEFPEVNVRISEHQEEYETLPVNVRPHKESNGFFNEVAMCIQLDEEERKQVSETGCVWLTILQPTGTSFNPIKTSLLKPDYLSLPFSELFEEEHNEWEAMKSKPAE